MNSKRKYAQISRKSSLSDGSPKQQSKLDIMMKKRMKPSSNDDPKSFMNSAGRKKFQSLKTSLTEATLSFSKINLKLKKIAKKVSLITVTQNS